MFWRATSASLDNAHQLTCQRTLQIYRWWIHFSIGTEGQSLFSDGELPCHRYRRYRRTVFWRATSASLDNAHQFTCQRTLQIYRWWIHLSIGTGGQSLFTDGELPYHRYRRTVFWRATLCHRNNANYLNCQRTFQIYRLCIHFFIGTDGQSLFTDRELTYHRYRRYRRTVFWRAILCHRNNANYLICQGTLQIYRWWINFSIATEGQFFLFLLSLLFNHL